MNLKTFYDSLGAFGRRMQDTEHEDIISESEIERIEVCYIESEDKAFEATLAKYVALTPENIFIIEYATSGTIKIKCIKRNMAIVTKEFTNLNIHGFPLEWFTQRVSVKCNGSEHIFYKPKEEYVPGNNAKFKMFVSKI
jgi:hypothetical protein